MGIIYSIGSSLRTQEEFINLLCHYQIKVVADVRRFPTSKLNHFKKEEIKELLQDNSISYCYLGEELGGYRKGGYEAYTASTNFLVGLEKLEVIAHQYTTAFMCAELLPWRCHRRFIGNCLDKRGWRVIHIINGKRVWHSTPE